MIDADDELFASLPDGSLVAAVEAVLFTVPHVADVVADVMRTLWLVP